MCPHALAELQVVSATDVRSRLPDAKVKLMDAALKDGIFYLDLSDDSDLQDCLACIRKLMEDVFSLDITEKERYDIDNFGGLKLNGYKPMGRNGGGINAQRDGFESYAVSDNVGPIWSSQQVLHIENQVAQKDVYKATGDTPRPLMIDHSLPPLQRLTARCMSLAREIFDLLSDGWAPAERSALQSVHGLARPTTHDSSMNIVRFLKYARNDESAFHVPQPAHTDMGSLTFLFADTPGLQILPRAATDWLYVPPRAGMALVNVGDALKILSGRKFHSVQHRVASLPGAGMAERYSLAFLLRPKKSTIMIPIDGSSDSNRKYTCEEWVTERFKALRGHGPRQSNLGNQSLAT